jgi:hypothetical protein
MLLKVPDQVPRVGKYGAQALGVGRAQSVCLATEMCAARWPARVSLLVEPVKDDQRSRQNGRESKGERVRKKAGGVIKNDVGQYCQTV